MELNPKTRKRYSAQKRHEPSPAGTFTASIFTANNSVATQWLIFYNLKRIN